MTESGADPSDGNAIYVFAVCGAPARVAVAGLPGVAADAAVRTLPFAELTAVVQTVRAADFADEAWQARLSDTRELERYARAHHHVVTAAAAACPTVPLPLATLYHDEERARLALTGEAGRFRAALARVAEHSEWGVKIYAAERPAAQDARRPAAEGSTTQRPPAVPADNRTRPAPGAGLAYLDRKRGMQARREQRQEEALRMAETVDAEFQKVAAAARRLRPHGPDPADDHGVQVLNATYLVAERRSGELETLTRMLQATTGARIELSGPWVPYSFVGEV
ncbi:GvpL/GvpF family gas vesicle protein [Streptomyces sp. NPDC057429]|uniref:GvpL/GvpF family gas vesicle protein n=1 Tax=Streptomyces sp. NPDC057429 TaxID=3346130 RepID=UPI00368799D2